MFSIKDFFNFNKRQEKGVFVLSFILLIVILSNHFSPQFAQKLPSSIQDHSEYLLQLELVKADENKKYKDQAKFNQKTNDNIILHPKTQFDPNLISTSEMKEMGLPVFVVNNIEKYRKSGGTFKKKESLARIYGMTNEMYLILEPFINIKQKSSPKTQKKAVKQKEMQPVAEITIIPDTILYGINTADSIQLLQVNGIGPFYAAAIVKYRNRLGGFIKMEQLFELYKMDTTKYQLMRSQLVLDTMIPKKININTVEFKALLKHPYVDYETTKYIINKRNRLGKYAALYQLKDSFNMPHHLYEKLYPYISVD